MSDPKVRLTEVDCSKDATLSVALGSIPVLFMATVFLLKSPEGWLLRYLFLFFGFYVILSTFYLLKIVVARWRNAIFIKTFITYLLVSMLLLLVYAFGVSHFSIKNILIFPFIALITFFYPVTTFALGVSGYYSQKKTLALLGILISLAGGWFMVIFVPYLMATFLFGL